MEDINDITTKLKDLKLKKQNLGQFYTTNYKYIKTLFDTTGIFTNPALSKLRIFMFLFTLFEISLVVLIMYVLYTILF